MAGGEPCSAKPAGLYDPKGGGSGSSIHVNDGTGSAAVELMAEPEGGWKSRWWLIGNSG